MVSLGMVAVALLAGSCAGKPAGQRPAVDPSGPRGGGAPGAGGLMGRLPRMQRAPAPPTAGEEPPAGLVALRDELGRAMAELGQKAQPAPYYISYEVFDRTETIISASYGALVQSTSRRTRLLDTDVRVGGYGLDSTHPLRSDALRALDICHEYPELAPIYRTFPCCTR